MVYEKVHSVFFVCNATKIQDNPYKLIYLVYNTTFSHFFHGLFPLNNRYAAVLANQACRYKVT